MEYKEFFKRYGQYGFSVNFYSSEEFFTVEQLYNIFTQRLLAECKQENK